MKSLNKLGTISDKWAETFSTDRKQAANFFSRMFNAYALAKVVTDDHGKPIDWIFLDVNDSFERITGIKRDIITGKSLMSVFPKPSENRYDWIEKLGNVAVTEKHENFESYFEGFEKWLNVSAYSPKKGYFIAIFEDVTERKKFEENVKEAKEKYQALIETIGDFIWEVDPQGRYTYCSPQMDKLWKLNPQEMIGKTPFDQMPPEAKEEGIKFFKSFVASQKPFNGIQVPSLDGQGNLIFLEISGVPFFNQKGELLGYRGITRDITERKKAGKEIADLAKFPMENPEAVLRIDKTGTILFANPKATEFMKEWQTKVGAKAPERISRKIVDALSLGNRVEFEENLGDQSYAIMVAPIAREGYANLYGRNVTLRKKAEEDLRISEANYKHLLEYAPTAIYEIDYVGPRFKSVNDAMCRLTGYTKEELMQKNPLELLTPESQERFRDRTKKILAGEKIDDAVEFTVVVKGGKEMQVILYVKPTYKDGKLDGALVVGYDITERKKNEEALKESEERFRSVLGNSLDIIYRYNIQTDHYEYMSPAIRRTGFEPEEFTSMNNDEVLSRVHPDDLPALKMELSRLVETGRGFCEYRFMGKDGIYTWLSNQMSITKDEKGQPLYRDGYMRDITERKKAEETVRTSEVWKATSFYTRNLIEVSLDPFVTISLDGKVTDINKATELATGCSRDELIGSDFSSYFTDPEKAAEGYKQVFTKGFVKDYPLIIRHKSGTTTDVLYNASVYRNERGDIQGVFAAARDITKRKKAETALRKYQEKLEYLVAARTKQARENEASALVAEEIARTRTRDLEETQEQLERKAAELEVYATRMEELAQERLQKLKDAERLAAIGATAGMVGHDIRNPLQAITGDIYLAASDVALLPPGELKKSLTETLDAIQTSVEYVNKIVQDLQDYARPLKPVFEETSLQKIIEDAVRKNEIPENIKFKQNLAEEAQTIRTDPDLLKRVLGNLVSNAIQAMPKGGELVLRAHRKGEYAIITVRDTGVGISPEVKEKLFTPLFTTKSKGQGFGLAVIKRITESLGGTITFESDVGKGTKFIVGLPQKTMQ